MADHSKYQQKQAQIELTQLDMFAPAPLNFSSQVRLVACAVCDDPFENRKANGRPKRFCGDACRLIQHKRQKTAWARRASLKSET